MGKEERQEIGFYDWEALNQHEVTLALLTLANAVGLRLVKVTDYSYPEGHPDRIKIEVEQE